VPALQLAAAAVVALILAIVPGAHKPYQFGQLGKIVLGCVVGTIFGLLLMGCVGVFFLL
jgi:hypothetical protein